MCGIVGAVGMSAQRSLVLRGLKTLVHRGPDATGQRDSGTCVLGHTRLRIIDLTEAADQPMQNDAGTTSVVFNGEIYNFRELRRQLRALGHQFRTLTDTEVLLHLYERHGADMVYQLEGMFAFAIWDQSRRRLLLARDRLGIKPLYYAAARGGLAFASESRVLATDNRIDEKALARYARMGWVSGPSTIYAGIAELPPGHLLEWKDGRASVRRWWSPPALTTAVPSGDDPLPTALRSAFGRQLVADVPVGLFLSGGVDSRALAHLACVSAPSLRTYTVAFDIGPDESAAAEAEAGRLGLSHTTVTVCASDVIGAIDDIVAAMDQPTVDGVNTWVISRAVREAGAVVALSGLGGDELFAGYSTFRRLPKIARAVHVSRLLPRPLTAAVAAGSQRLSSHQVRRLGSALSGDDPWAEAYAAMRGITTGVELAALWPERCDHGLDGIVTPLAANAVDKVTQMELANYLPHQLLRDTDAMSMAHSLEVRVPLLDELVVNAAMRAPVDASGRSGKERLAAAVSPELVPRALAPKQTFTLPFDQWLQGPLGPRAREGLTRLTDHDVGFDSAAVDALWLRWQDGRAHWRTVWGLAVLGMWIDGR